MNYLSADHPNRPCSTKVGDKPGHVYAIDQINRTAIKDEIAGVEIKSGRMAARTTKYAFTGTFQERRLSIRKQQVVMDGRRRKMKGGKVLGGGTC